MNFRKYLFIDSTLFLFEDSKEVKRPNSENLNPSQ